MNTKIWGIIGGVALVLALLSPLVLGNSKKIEQLFEAAEELYERADYKGAITKYSEALKESKKFGAKTETIDKDFTTLVNLKIAQCYYELGEETSDVRHYQNALTHIKKVVLDTQVIKHQEELTYLWAENLYKIGDLDQAVSKFSWLIERFPNSQWVPKAWYRIGDIDYQQKNYDEALNAYQKLVEKFPHSEFKVKAEQHIAEIRPLVDNINSNEDDHEHYDQTMYNTASHLRQQGKVLNAYQLYTDLITQYPDSKYVTDAYIGRAEIHLEAEGYVNARTNYEEAIYRTDDEKRRTELYRKYQLTYLIPVYANRIIQHDPSDELFVKARLLQKEKRFLVAAEIYEKLANSSLSAEDTVYALYWVGRCYHEATCTNSSLFGKSVDAFKKLISEYEDSAYTIKAYYYLALAYKDWAKVFGNEFKWQLVISTVGNANTRYGDSDDRRHRGWLSRMQELKNEASNKLPPSPLDRIKEEAKRAIIDAETEIARVKLEDNESQQIYQANKYLEQAKQKMSRNDYRATLNLAKKSLEIVRNMPIPPSPPKQRYVDEGYIHLGKGELEEATRKAKQALEINPNYQRACDLLSEIKESHYGRGWTFFDEGQYEKAIAEFRNAINIDLNFKEAHCHLGVIYIEQQKYTEAIKTLEKAIKIDEAFTEAHFNLALAHLELGDFEDATNAANAALKINPNYEPARMLIEFIAD